MDFVIPERVAAEADRFERFLETELVPHLPTWLQEEAVPAEFYHAMGGGGWFGLAYDKDSDTLVGHSALREALLAERLSA